MVIRNICLLAGTISSALSAEGLRGPVSGYLFDESAQSIRPVIGMPGAAVVGQPLDLPILLKRAVSRGSDAVVGISNETPGRALIVRASEGVPTVSPIADALPGAENLVLSPAGTAALLYTADTAQVITGLPDRPHTTAGIGLPGSVLAAAISDDGQTALFVTDASSAAGLYRIVSGAAPELVSDDAGGIIALEMVNRGHDAAALDAAAGKLLLLADVAGAAVPLLLADAAAGLDSPIGMSVTSDGSTLLVANGSSQSVVMADATLQSSSRTADLPIAPAGCARLGQGAVFVLSSPSARPIYVLDLSGPATAVKVFFVPVE